MKGLVEKLKQKYPKIEYGEKSYFHPDVYLFQKWAYKIPKGWYGFSLGQEVPFIWARIIDEFLTGINKYCPNFQILQVKVKFSFLRIYLDLNIGDNPEKTLTINHEINKLEEWLHDQSLLY